MDSGLGNDIRISRILSGSMEAIATEEVITLQYGMP